MNQRIKQLFFLPVLIATLIFIPAGRVTAQTFTTLHNFVGFQSDGANPQAGLILSGSTLYGTTSGGGSNYTGTIFAVNTNGTGFTTLHNFTVSAYDSSLEVPSNSDGIMPNAGLILSGNTLYGTTYGGGSNGVGTVFAIGTNGTDFSVLHTFSAETNFSSNNDGAFPQAGLIFSGNTLYGTTMGGGTNGSGTVFAINTDGTCFTDLHTFATLVEPPHTGGGGRGGGGGGGFSPATNSDGASSSSELTLSGDTLYGTAYLGGTNGSGTVFAVNTNGTGFTVLHTFNASSPIPNSDGANPYAGLILSGSTLYGTTYAGGTNGSGTVFAVDTNGINFRTLHHFAVGNVPSAYYLYTNSDGANPYSGLVLSGNTLYGTTYWGGTNGDGTMFAVNTNGTGFGTLYTFTLPLGPQSGSQPSLTNNDGAFPYDGLILSGNTLYGMAENGGTNGDGTIFSLTLPVIAPQMAIIPFGANNNFVMSWPTNATGFTLESTTNLSSQVWNTNLSSPVIVNGQNTVTNSVSGAQQFFRLWHP